MLTHKDALSCPIRISTYVLIFRPISPELVLFPDIFVANIYRDFFFTLEYLKSPEFYHIKGIASFDYPSLHLTRTWITDSLVSFGSPSFSQTVTFNQIQTSGTWSRRSRFCEGTLCLQKQVFLRWYHKGAWVPRRQHIRGLCATNFPACCRYSNGNKLCPLLADFFLLICSRICSQRKGNICNFGLISHIGTSMMFFFLSINNPQFENYLGQMYPVELRIKGITEGNESNLDLLISMGRDSQVHTWIYEKTWSF